MSFRYDDVQGVSKEEFSSRALTVDQAASDPTFRRATPDEVRKVEELLDLKSGILGDFEWHMNQQTCPNCGRELGIYDFVNTAINEANHNKSDIVHTLVGNKYVVNPPRKVTCSNCGVQALDDGTYSSLLYGCTGN